jgi:hypothetical protein
MIYVAIDLLALVAHLVPSQKNHRAPDVAESIFIS